MSQNTENFDWDDAVAALQVELARCDLISGPASPYPELLLLRQQNIAIRMDGNLNHGCPHLHLDYARRKHIASYALATGKRLVGDATYDRPMSKWIATYRGRLHQIWTEIRSGVPNERVLAELSGSTF